MFMCVNGFTHGMNHSNDHQIENRLISIRPKPQRWTCLNIWSYLDVSLEWHEFPVQRLHGDNVAVVLVKLD